MPTNQTLLAPNPLKPLSLKDDLDGKPLIPVFDRLFTFSAYVAKHMTIRGALAANHQYPKLLSHALTKLKPRRLSSFSHLGAAARLKLASEADLVFVGHNHLGLSRASFALPKLRKVSRRTDLFAQAKHISSDSAQVVIDKLSSLIAPLKLKRSRHMVKDMQPDRAVIKKSLVLEKPVPQVLSLSLLDPPTCPEPLTKPDQLAHHADLYFSEVLTTKLVVAVCCCHRLALVVFSKLSNLTGQLKRFSLNLRWQNPAHGFRSPATKGQKMAAL